MKLLSNQNNNQEHLVKAYFNILKAFENAIFKHIFPLIFYKISTRLFTV